MVLFVSLWHTKARKWVRGRRNIQADIRVGQNQNKKTIWFHCASVGEFEQALPLIDLYRRQYHGHQILTTFYSPSGYEYAKSKYPEEWTAYLPFEFESRIAAMIESVNPEMVFVIKYEFWYVFLSTLYKKGIPVFLVAGIFRKQQMFFRPPGIFHRKMLGFFTHFFVQDENSLDLLKSIGINNVSIAGDTRFDRVTAVKDMAFEDEKILHFINSAKVFVAGSIWDSDIPVLRIILEALPADWKIILAPHEADHFSTEWINERFDLYSRPAQKGSRILLIDTIGLLSKLYRYAFFAYVGGGYGKGIHNILEPAVYLKPVLIGPEFTKFREARELTALGCVFVVDTENTCSLLKNTIFDENKYKQIAQGLLTYISMNTNLSAKIIVFVERLMDGRSKVF